MWNIQTEAVMSLGRGVRTKRGVHTVRVDQFLHPLLIAPRFLNKVRVGVG